MMHVMRHKILFDRYSGSKINIDDVEYLIIREEDVLGILSQDKTDLDTEDPETVFYERTGVS